MINNALPEEQELLIQLTRGSERAFTKIYKFYSPCIYRKVLSQVKSQDIAKDTVQEVFIKIWELRQDIEVGRPFFAYLYKIAANQVNDLFRKEAAGKKLHKQLLKSSTGIYNHVEEGLINKENVEILNNAINLLPAQRQKIFKLCKMDGKSYREVREDLNISESAISDHIVKGTQTIRKHVLLRA